MSEKEIEKLPTATLADLLGTGPEEKWIEVQGKKVKIRKLNLGDLQKITQYAGDDPWKNAIAILQRALIEPKMNINDIQRLPPVIANKLVREIAELSGWTPAQIRAAENL